MATIFGSSLASPSSGLTAANIDTLIKATLNAQRGPINTLTAQKDELNIKKAVCSDLKSRLSTFKGVVEDLTSYDADTVFDNVKATSSDTDVVTATATSSAASGTYSIEVTNLAKAHRVWSEQQDSSSEALDLSGTFSLNGVSITVETDDSLTDIMNAINNADYADGKEFVATIVDKQLIIEAASTGTSNELDASDTDGTILSGTKAAGSGLGILDAPEGDFIASRERAAEDASFDVNGITVTRASNTDLDDVIDGVSLNLLSETEGTDKAESELEVSPDYAAIRAKISAFVSNLNSTLSYLKEKTQTTADQDNNTYTRGALAGGTVFSRLRADLVAALRTQGPSGWAEYLEDIGITVGDGLELSLDESTLNSMLESNFADVVQLFNTVMEKYVSILEPFTTSTSSSNTMDLYTDSIETKVENIDSRIERMERMLELKEEMLIQQYSGIYMRSMQMQDQQSVLLSIYSGFSATA